MIGILLEFEVKKGFEDKFLKAWDETTEIIYRNFGSLGSRLHREEEGLYVAYAQWPSIEVYESEQHWSDEDLSVREAMRAALVGGKPRSIRRLSIVSDLLKNEPA